MTESVTCTIEDNVAVIRMDDGKANAVGHAVIDALHGALDRALDEARAVAIIGREGKFCAGYDLSVMTEGPDATRGLVGAGGKLAMRLFTHPQPVVAGITGHALAAGAIIAMSCDTRIGADAPAKIGLNETAIGMGMPWYGVRLAEARLAKNHLTPALVQARLYSPAEAVEVGYLDRIVPADQVEKEAIVEASQLGSLPSGAYKMTKLRVRQSIADEVLAGLDEDMQNMVPPTPKG